MASPLSAASAYAKLARLAADPSGALAMPKAGPASAGPDFGALVKEAIGSVVDVGHASRTRKPRPWRPARPISSTS